MAVSLRDMFAEHSGTEMLRIPQEMLTLSEPVDANFLNRIELKTCNFSRPKKLKNFIFQCFYI